MGLRRGVGRARAGCGRAVDPSRRRCAVLGRGHLAGGGGSRVPSRGRRGCCDRRARGGRLREGPRRGAGTRWHPLVPLPLRRLDEPGRQDAHAARRRVRARRGPARRRQLPELQRRLLPGVARHRRARRGRRGVPRRLHLRVEERRRRSAQRPGRPGGSDRPGDVPQQVPALPLRPRPASGARCASVRAGLGRPRVRQQLQPHDQPGASPSGPLPRTGRGSSTSRSCASTATGSTAAPGGATSWTCRCSTHASTGTPRSRARAAIRSRWAPRSTCRCAKCTRWGAPSSATPSARGSSTASGRRSRTASPGSSSATR